MRSRRCRSGGDLVPEPGTRLRGLQLRHPTLTAVNDLKEGPLTTTQPFTFSVTP